MSGWKFVRSWRWSGYLAFTIVFALACVLLSQWQLARRAEAVSASAKIEMNYDRAPVALTALLPTLDSFDGQDEWRQIELRGRYQPDEQLLVRTRPLSGSPGFEVLVPLLTAEGNLFVVNRGWVPVGSDQDSPDDIPDAPSGDVSVVARLRPAEPGIPGRTAPPGQIATIQLSSISRQLGAPTYTGAYGLMVTENPTPPKRPKALPRPATDEGPHLSYAFQWIVFAILGFVGLAWAVRQEYRVVNAEVPSEKRRALRRELRRKERNPTDAEVEDELIERAAGSSASS